MIFSNNHDYELIENISVKNLRQINRVIGNGDRMVIDEMKKEMVEFGFDQNQIDNATEIIYFIGVGQDLAWREGEGVIRSDISINKSLLNFLKQGYILEDESKYAKYPIYKLNVQGEEIFQELIEANKPNFKRFKTEFLEINPKTFAILSLPDNPNNKDIDRLEVQYECKILFNNSKKGDQIKHIFYNQLHNFHTILEKYDLIIKLTSFQSNKMDSKGKFIKGNNFYQLLIEYIESFPTQLYDSITELNKKVSFFDDLIISIQKIEIRDEISDIYPKFYDEYKFLLENLKDNKIITTFDPSKSPCFKIIDEQKYKNEIGKLKKECIDKVTEPIIDELIGGYLNTSSQPVSQPVTQPITSSQPVIQPVTLSQPITPPITSSQQAAPQQQILFGFECGTGNAIRIKPAHLFISGVTHEAGKTTTLEALIERSGLSAISFITKPGEECFEKGEIHKTFFQEDADWKVIEKLFESLLGEKMKDVRPKLIELCKHEKTLKSIKQSIDNAVEDSKGTERKSLILLQAYFEDLFDELKDKEYISDLNLKSGVNLMDLTEYREELQSFIINSVLNQILKNYDNTIVLIPEAWKFIPQTKGTPCKYSITQLVRQGAVKNNFIWFDSQDIAGVDKQILKQVSIWMLGLQTESNEVNHTIEQIPLPKNKKPTSDVIMNLQVGEFFVSSINLVKKIYVMPKWMNENEAKEIAKSKKPFNS